MKADCWPPQPASRAAAATRWHRPSCRLRVCASWHGPRRPRFSPSPARACTRSCRPQEVSIGNLRLFADDVVPDAVREQAVRLESLGKTTMLVRADGAFLGLLALADTPRPAMREVFARLASFGIRRTVMLTGDNEQVARAVAASVGITDVRAGLLPEDKLKVIDELMRDKADGGDGRRRCERRAGHGTRDHRHRHGRRRDRRGAGNGRRGTDG